MALVTSPPSAKWQDIQQDCLQYICRIAGPEATASCAAVCRQWSHVCGDLLTDDGYWRGLCRQLSLPKPPTSTIAAAAAAAAGGNAEEVSGSAGLGPGSAGPGGLDINGGADGATSRDDASSEGAQGSRLLSGLKQRLLSFVYRKSVSSPEALSRFYYHFQHYEDLIMWKVQFLDRDHLLIKLGSTEGFLCRSADGSCIPTAFFAVYNIATTEVGGFFLNSSEAFLALADRFTDHFRGSSQPYPSHQSFISSSANNDFMREQVAKQQAAVLLRTKTGQAGLAIKRSLQAYPFTSQSVCASPYFDQSLFHFDEKLISALDYPKPFVEHPIKFLSRRKPNTLKFKIIPAGQESTGGDARNKKLAHYIFHPTLPFAISVQQSFMQPSLINFHLRRDP